MIWHYKLMVNFLRLWTTLLYNHKVEIYKAPLVPSRLLWFILRSRVEGQIREDWGWMSTSYESLIIALCTIPRQFQFIQVEISEHLSNEINKTRKHKRTRPDVSDEQRNLKPGKLDWHEKPRKYSLITVRKPWHLFVCLFACFCGGYNFYQCWICAYKCI